MKKTVKEKLDFLSSFIRNYKLEKDDTNLSIWCPFCKNKDKNKLKLVMHLEKNFYHCWICDKSGGISSLIWHLDKSKVQESKNYFKSYKKTFSLFDEKEEEIDLSVELPRDFRLISNNLHRKDKDLQDLVEYCRSRGFNKHKILMLKVGYSNVFEFRRSLIIPSFDENGAINFYTSRKIDASTNDPYKYNNARIQKKYIIFNDLNIDWSIPLTLVEGPLDLIKTNDNATCLLGSSLTEDMLLFQKIVKNKTPVNIALDRDAYYKAVRIGNLLSNYDVDVNIVDTRKYSDVGDMPREYFENILTEANTFNKDDLLLNKIKNL